MSDAIEKSTEREFLAAEGNNGSAGPSLLDRFIIAIVLSPSKQFKNWCLALVTLALGEEYFTEPTFNLT